MVVGRLQEPSKFVAGAVGSWRQSSWEVSMIEPGKMGRCSFGPRR